MKSFYTLILFSFIIFYSCSDNQEILIDSYDHNEIVEKRGSNSFYTETYGNDLYIFHENSIGNISEYLLIQGTNDKPEEVVDFFLSSYGEIATIVSLNGSVTYTTIGSSTNSVFGIAHFFTENVKGVSKELILSKIGGGGKPGCDDHCLSGGCGATDCQRTIWKMTCSVTCNSGYFACCGDMVTDECQCIENACCGSSK